MSPSKTLLDFFPILVQQPPPRRPRRNLTAATPPPRKQPLTGGRTSVLHVGGSAEAIRIDSMRRCRPRSVARVHHSGPINRPAPPLHPGYRYPREVPLTVEELWLSAGGPPFMKDVSEPFECAICLQLKSHPVACGCGHSFCYVCIRIWLEEQWECPSCRAIVGQEPNRIWAEEGYIAAAFGAWDTSVVDYDWSGLVFPVVKRGST
ncbi:hypothetical protein DFH06DRAFT_1208093 [Mycena polygramma]|nr:hypothetical protein DFH06DRAFT_1208093 [Mycena polygramma]